MVETGALVHGVLDFAHETDFYGIDFSHMVDPPGGLAAQPNLPESERIDSLRTIDLFTKERRHDK